MSGQEDADTYKPTSGASPKDSTDGQLDHNSHCDTSQCCFNEPEPIDDFLQCHFEPGTWKEIESSVASLCDHQECELGDGCELDDCCLDLCNFNCDYPVNGPAAGSNSISSAQNTVPPDVANALRTAVAGGMVNEPETTASTAGLHHNICDVDVSDWTNLETCNSVIRCSPPAMTDTLTTPSSLSTTDTDNMMSLLEPELGDHMLLQSSTKLSNVRTDQHKPHILHPERPHIHEHFPRSDPHHHYHLHYQNKLNGSVIQHDLILPSNFPFCSSMLADSHCAVHGYTQHHDDDKHTPQHQPLSSEDPSPSEQQAFIQQPVTPPISMLPPAKRQKTESPPVENLVCKWDDCNSTLPNGELSRHMFEQHLTSDWLQQQQPSQDQKEYQCEWLDCMFSTNELDKLFEHIPDCHGAKQVKAVKNEKVKREREQDVEQIQHVCLWVDPETHDRCDQVFKTTGALTDHIISEHVKSGKSTYVCHWEGCSRNCRAFSQRQKIVRHLNTHTKHKPFQCPTCGKKFSLDLMLQQHMRIHTGERPYECKVCGKHFKTSSSLTIHSRIHSGDKPMVCNICGKRFNESSNLNKHMKIHNRKFKCELCLKSFEKESRYQKHLAACKARHERTTNLHCECCKGERVDDSSILIEEFDGKC